MMVWKMIFLYNWVIFRFHVNLPGCITFWFNPVLLWIDKLFDDETIHRSLNQRTPFAKRNGSDERKIIVGVSIIVQLFQRLDGS